MFKLIRLFVFLLVIAFLLATPLLLIPQRDVSATALLTNVYVNGTTGNNSYNGSSPVYTSGNNGPKQTIAAGISAVSTTGTVYVASGTYVEHGLHLGDTMNLVGAGALTTIIDGNASGYVLEVASAPFQRNTISGFTIQNGAPFGSDAGGGIYISQAHIVTINDCTIINNVKGDGAGPYPNAGGGICNDGGALYMNRCTVSGNTASGSGGGIFSRKTFGGDSGLAELTNCTISNNTVTADGGSGGGICKENSGNLRLVNVTIANNRATGLASYGGAFANITDSLIPVTTCYFTNCIVANNTSGDGAHNNGYDIFTGTGIDSLGYNIDSENTCYFTETTDQRNSNPLLGVLQNNGGPTSTHAITISSPAYNRGTNTGAPATDQRGVVRPQGTSCDIGAFELELTPTASVATATGTGTSTFNTSAGSISNLTASTSTACGTKPGFNFPHGFFSYNITDITAGSTVTITITLPSAIPIGTQYWKCINGSWINVTSLLGDDDGDTVLTLTIRDGGLGDADGLVNGAITDPGGPATVIPIAATPDKPKPFMDSSSSPQMPEQITKSGANLSVKYLTVQPQKTAINQPITIAANMANSGDASGKYIATLKINGQIEQTKTGTVGAHVAQPISFTVSKDKPGTYTVDINGQQSSFTIIGQPASKNTMSTAGILYIVLAIMIIAVFILAILVIQRRRDNF